MAILLTCFLFIFNLSVCVAANVDSLFQVVENTTDPAEKIEQYIVLLKELDKTMDQRIPKVAEEMISFSKRNKILMA